jgi:hypothetical protein
MSQPEWFDALAGAVLIMGAGFFAAPRTLVRLNDGDSRWKAPACFETDCLRRWAHAASRAGGAR